MSHVTDVKLRVKDIDALEEAAQACGLEFLRDKKDFCWWGTYVGDSRSFGQHDPKDFGKCEHAMREPGTNPRNGSGGPWEIGVVKAVDGEGFDLLYDTYGGAGQRLTKLVGTNASKLRREYSAAVATQKARAKLSRRGFDLHRENLGSRIRLTLRKR